MKIFNFGTPTPIPFRLSDFPGLTAGIRAAGTISAETDDDMRGQQLKTICLSLLNGALAEYSSKVTKDGLAGLVPELKRTLSDKLTERSGTSCVVNIVSLTFDDSTQKIIDETELAEKMSDPEFAAKKMAEAEEEARKKLIDALNNSSFDDRIIKGDCVPPLGMNPGMIPMGMNVTGGQVFDGGYAGRFENPAKTGFIMPQAMQPDTVPAAPNYDGQWDRVREDTPPKPQPVTGIMADYRPKFCMHCGQRLSPTGSFCGECGKPIM